MRTIKVVNSPTGKSIRKVLLNRSRSGNLGDLKFFEAKPRKNVSPYRNSIGLKNPEGGSQQNKQNTVLNKLNQDYYHFGNPESNKINTKKTNTRVQAPNIPNIQKKPIIKEMQCKKNKDEYGWFTLPNTVQNSKFSSGSSNGIRDTESEYIVSGYQSPSFKLKKLQTQKCLEKKKAKQKLQQIVKKQEKIQQSRTCHKLQLQLYEQIIKKLQRQSYVLKSTCQIYSNNNSSLKNSKSGETEEGETSNEI